MDGQGWSFPIIKLTFQVRKVMGGIVQSAMLVVLVAKEGHGRSRNVMECHGMSWNVTLVD